MNYKRHILLVTFLSFIGLSSTFGKSAWEKDLVANINQSLKESGVKKSELGLVITFFNNQKQQKLFGMNSKKQFIPASLTKVLTASAVLDSLPVGYKAKTQVLSRNKKVKNGVLKGDLFLKGGGDPSFVSESLWNLVNKFTRNGIRTIEGNIIVDDSYFDAVRYDPGRERSRVDRAYDAPIGAMSFNWNSINIFVRPTKLGHKVQVIADPENEYIKVFNSATTTKGGQLNIKVRRIDEDEHFGDVYEVTGTMPEGHDEKVYYKGITRPALWSGYHLKAFLQRRGILLQGLVKLGRVPKEAIVLAEEESRDFSLVVRDMMKFSNNYVAEMLTKHLSVVAGSEPGNMNGGLEKIKMFLGKVGFADGTFRLVNPSGLTRKNSFSPNQINEVLSYNKNKFLVFPEYVYSLPVSGVDGTLERRMTDRKYQGWVRAKTGRLQGVTGLAGYASNKIGRIYTFTYMFNGSHSRLEKANALFDQISQHLVDSL